MITPAQGFAFMKQMGDLQKPGGMGIGAPPAGSPTQGLIARLMSDNPGGLLGALTKNNNAPANPGMPPAAGDPAYMPGGQGPMAGGPAPQMGMLAGLLAKLKPQMGMGGPVGSLPLTPAGLPGGAGGPGSSLQPTMMPPMMPGAPGSW